MGGHGHRLANGQIRPQCIVLVYVRGNVPEILRVAGAIFAIDGDLARYASLAKTGKRQGSIRFIDVIVLDNDWCINGMIDAHT